MLQPQIQGEGEAKEAEEVEAKEEEEGEAKEAEEAEAEVRGWLAGCCHRSPEQSRPRRLISSLGSSRNTMYTAQVQALGIRC